MPRVKRSDAVWVVALFLSTYGESDVSGQGVEAAPPEETGVTSWQDALDLFQESLGEGMTGPQFRNSLGNARNWFDSHVSRVRAGWKEPGGSASRLPAVARRIRDEWSGRSREEFWEEVRKYAGNQPARSTDPATEPDPGVTWRRYFALLLPVEIGHGYQWLTPLGDAEYAALRESIRLFGVMIPVMVDEDGSIIDGYHTGSALPETRDRLAPQGPKRSLRGGEMGAGPGHERCTAPSHTPGTGRDAGAAERTHGGSEPPRTDRETWAFKGLGEADGCPGVFRCLK